MEGPISKKKKFFKLIFSLFLIALFVYGSGRLYFRITAGFREKHISSDFAFDPRWQTRPLLQEENKEIASILSQKFYYLGKGCQSYVFQSEDGKHVIKFLKYQRFRPQFYLYWFSVLPVGERVLQEKIEKKKEKREHLFSSWKIAFDHLQEETGLVFVHLNKTKNLKKKVEIYDKAGIKHVIDMDEMEFLIQKKADMLCKSLDALMKKEAKERAKELLTKLVGMVVTEYQRGLADNDHALMQNTGVYQGSPVHIDVGQFEWNASLKDPMLYHQELFNKMWKFRNWLKEHFPELLIHVDTLLEKEMGERFYEIKFIPRTGVNKSVNTF